MNTQHMIDVAETKIREGAFKVYRAAYTVGDRFSQWSLERQAKNLDARLDRIEVRLDRSEKELGLDEAPVDYSLTPAGRELIARSLSGHETLFIVDSDGVTNTQDLTR